MTINLLKKIKIGKFKKYEIHLVEKIDTNL